MTLSSPPTEERNLRTAHIDLVPTRAVLGLLNREDELVPAAVRSVLGTLATVVDEAADRVGRGGRVHYFGAGSSGRIAVLDATELVPTFGLEPDTVIAHLAGGNEAMDRAAEGAEDDSGRGSADTAGVNAGDLVIGLSASGRTPYVAGALTGASERGAFGVLVTCNPASPLRALADVSIVAETGPEAIAGSTRLKATTALKLILNSFSTALMVRLGKTYSNLMIEVSATNSKLRERLVRILVDASGAGEAACEAALARAGGNVKLAMVDLLSGGGVRAARQALTASDGSVRGALAHLDTVAPGLAVVAERGRVMAAEMSEQPRVLRSLAARSGEIARQLRGMAPEPLNGVLIFGRESSGHAGEYGSYLLGQTTGRPAVLVPPDMGVRGDLDYRGYLAIAVSRSGETPDVVAALMRLQRAGARCIAITNAPGSPLAAAAECVIDVAAGPQRARPATSTVTAQMLAFALLAGAMNPHAVDAGVLAETADQVEAVLGEPPARALAALLGTTPGVVSVGDGWLRAAAREMALKVTETTSVLAAAYPAAEFRCGPAAALRPGLAVVGFGDGRGVLEDGYGDRASLRAQAAGRGADWIEISPADDAAIGLPRGLPGYALPLLAVVRAQQLAWTAALMAGRDPDGAPLRRAVTARPARRERVTI
ncbi:MAG: N-acetylmuramic acid 6-phosphate etherase [Streptosporangiaceae bacterium]|nr:N-acetylmuramic acid 6-phosphate etherase [Streptosporangiaceae bacterium]MBV9855368.1 N-acetylmuramic acid 6-phosphate etherase [Streptosporangiaceae bacterium]